MVGMAERPIERVAILGTGGMGTALAVLLAGVARSGRLWGRGPALVAEMADSGENRRPPPGVPLPGAVLVTTDAAEAAAEADLIVAAVPSAYLRRTLKALAPTLPAGVPALSVIKGIENETFARPSRIIAEELGDRPVAVLS